MTARMTLTEAGLEARADVMVLDDAGSITVSTEAARCDRCKRYGILTDWPLDHRGDKEVVGADDHHNYCGACAEVVDLVRRAQAAGCTDTRTGSDLYTICEQAIRDGERTPERVREIWDEARAEAEAD